MGVAQLPGRKFAFDDYLHREYRWNVSKLRPICPYYGVSTCPKGRYCPDRHILPLSSYKIVCRHWLKGLCKKGDQCEFLHEYNMRKLPECPYYTKNGHCTQYPDCLFRHPDAESKLPTCAAYDKGFCRLGPKCPKRHILREPCQNYIAGFCPDGPTCSFGHPRFFQIDDSMRIAPDPTERPSWQR